MVQVLIWVLHGVAQVLDVSLHVFGGLELRVAEDHLLLVAFDVVGEVEFLILIKHLKEDLVVDDALALVRHVGCDGLDHRLQHGDDLLGEMGEFHALLVKFVLLYWVVHVFLDVEQSSILLNDVQSAGLWDCSEELFDVTGGSGENLELLGIEHVVKSCHFLEESLEVESSLVDELDVFAANSLLWRQQRNWDTWPSLDELLVKLKEVAVSALTLPNALLVRSFALVENVTTLVLGMSA